MYIYIFAFSISCFLIYAKDKVKGKGAKRLFIALAILVPSLLAGLRDQRIGTDVMVYGVERFNSALITDSFGAYFNKYATSILSEPLYLLVTYVMSRLSRDFHSALFVYELITVSFAYLAMRKFVDKNGGSVAFGMLIYYFSLYNYSLNLMRQAIAITILFYAVQFLFDNEKFKFFIFFFIAVGFHSSAVIGLAFVVMYYMLRINKNKPRTVQLFQGAVFFVMMAIAVIAFEKVIIKLVSFGFLRENYLNYIAGGKYAVGGVVSVREIFFNLICILIFVLLYKASARRGQEPLMFMMNSGVVLLLCFAPLMATYLARVGQYFVPLQLISLTSVISCAKKSQQWVYKLVLLVLIVLNWYLVFVVSGSCETVPYQFMRG